MPKKKKPKKKTEEEEQEEFFDQLEDEFEDDEESDDFDHLDDEPDWIDEDEEEGQLSVDVYEEGDSIIIKSTIAGVEPEDIDISIVNDMLTIRGERKEEKSKSGKEYFFQECYWGAFSRSIILPVEVDTKNIDAAIKNGILTVTLPKLKKEKKGSIKIKDEN